MPTSVGDFIVGTQRVCLHPLVVLNITDHVSRLHGLNCCDRGSNVPKDLVVGILLGRVTHEGSHEICASFEAVGPYLSQSGDVHGLDWGAMKQKREQLAQVTPDLSVVGCYVNLRTMGDVARCCAAVHYNLRGEFCEVSEGALFAMIVDYNRNSKLSPSPIYLFEASFLTDPGEPQTCCEPPVQNEVTSSAMCYEVSSTSLSSAMPNNARFDVVLPNKSRLPITMKRIDYVLQEEDAQQVGLDLTLRISADIDDTSNSITTTAIGLQLHRVALSLQLLRNKTQQVIKYINTTENNANILLDTEVLRHVGKVCALTSSGFSSALSHSEWAGGGGVCMKGHVAQLVALLSLQSRCVAGLQALLSAHRRRA
ncbi:unnamed protein product [Trypanosoma congolense IL3000]|uniref:WGS project CAEQ00000000 data, annotated contig 267 n=1 Tax=Trypanosoma congolense (strain IL3000) TaxID=1068625 RepID=F9WEH0_TRYCI|nr:unnamed protein product [Trypanosoma congolense IL3000]